MNLVGIKWLAMSLKNYVKQISFLDLNLSQHISVSFAGPLINLFLIGIYISWHENLESVTYIKLTFYAALITGPTANFLINDLIRSIVNMRPIMAKVFSTLFLIHFSLIVLFINILTSEQFFLFCLFILSEITFVFLKSSVLSSHYKLYLELSYSKIFLTLWLISKGFILLLFTDLTFMNNIMYLGSLLIILGAVLLAATKMLTELLRSKKITETSNYAQIPHWRPYLIAVANSLLTTLIPSFSSMDKITKINPESILAVGRILMSLNIFLATILERTFSKKNFDRKTKIITVYVSSLLLILSYFFYYIEIFSLAYIVLTLSKQLVRVLWGRLDFIDKQHNTFQLFNAAYLLLSMIILIWSLEFKVSILFYIVTISNIFAYFYFNRYITRSLSLLLIVSNIIFISSLDYGNAE